MIINVSTIDDPRLDAYARLTEVQLRNKLEPEKGMFIAESSKVIERAVAGGMQPLSLLMEEKFLPGMQPIIEQIEQRYPDFDLPVFILPHGQQTADRFRAHARCSRSLPAPHLRKR